jgi:glycerate kinase
MRVLVAPDSFKGTFSATDAAAAIGLGVADGGGEAAEARTLARLRELASGLPA